LKTIKIVEFFLITGTGIWGKLSELEPELEPDKNGPAPQHCKWDWVPGVGLKFGPLWELLAGD
jgi:hypothetical protein